MSTVVDANTFKCVIELAEEDTEYEIMVVPETSARSRINTLSLRLIRYFFDFLPFLFIPD